VCSRVPRTTWVRRLEQWKQVNFIEGSVHHTGYHKGCKICMQMKKKLRRVYHTKDPFKCVKTGHTWSLDTLCWPIKSKQGNKYTNVLRDYASGYFILVHVAKKSDTAAAIKAMVICQRAMVDTNI
jgi:hypothetical protein